MKESSPKGWHNKETAEIYDAYAKRFSMYLNTNRELITLADIHKGMSIVDLACGTGVTTSEILKHLKKSGRVYAVDLSAAMLEVAKKNISAPNVSFVESNAEELDNTVTEKVDLVLCNSAFWQIRDRSKALVAIRQVLKDGGKFFSTSALNHLKFQMIQKKDQGCTFGIKWRRWPNESMSTLRKISKNLKLSLSRK